MLQTHGGHVLRRRQDQQRQNPADQQLVLTSGTSVVTLLREAFARGEPCWITARGTSMAPTWHDGARLLIGPDPFETLLPGDCLLYRHHDDLIVHRFLRRRRTTTGWWFQAKADARCLPDDWQPSAAYLGRVLAIADGDTVRQMDRGRALWRQRCIGLRERVHAQLHELWLRMAPRVPRALDSSGARGLTWARNIVAQQRLLGWLAAMDGQPILLKGWALVATGDADPAARELGDADLLVRAADVARAQQRLAAQGVRVHGPAGALRQALDDQVLLEDHDGMLLDLHWRISGGWRFRDVIAIDHEALWARARTVLLAGRPVLVLSLEDQLLHLCVHLALGGFVGLKWWRDLQQLIERHHAALDWAAVIKRASAWRVRAIVWLILDMLWQRWNVRIPVGPLRALRPPAWKRLGLRALLPSDLTDASHESRARRHLRELLLMDRGRDRCRLLWRWSRPPLVWFRFRQKRHFDVDNRLASLL